MSCGGVDTLYTLTELISIAIATGYLDKVVESFHNLSAITDGFIIIECQLSYHLNNNMDLQLAIYTLYSVLCSALLKTTL